MLAVCSGVESANWRKASTLGKHAPTPVGDVGADDVWWKTGDFMEALELPD